MARRHKRIAYYEGDRGLFTTLREKGFVAFTYEYSTKSKQVGRGAVYKVKDGEDVFIAIATNEVRTVRFRNGGYNHTAYYWELFRLTEEGWNYLKKKIVTNVLKRHA